MSTKSSTLLLRLILATGMLLPAIASAGVSPAGTAFNYQAQLKKNGAPFTELCDFRFGLWEFAEGSSGFLGQVQINGVSVENGLFSVEIDFGPDQFNGDERWLEIQVMCPAAVGPQLPDFTTLQPRQRINPVPYA